MTYHRSKDGRFIPDPAKASLACEIAVHNALIPAPYVPTYREKNPPVGAFLRPTRDLPDRARRAGGA